MGAGRGRRWEEGGEVPAVEKQLWQPAVTFEHSVYIE